MRIKGAGRRASVVLAAVAIATAPVLSLAPATAAPVDSSSGSPIDGSDSGSDSVSGLGPVPGPGSGSDFGSDFGSDLGALLSEPPTVPYEPPQLEHGGVRSPVIPAAAWNGAERAIGRAMGADLGMDAFADHECTPMTVIHVPGSGETNEQRGPDVPHGRIVSGLGHDLAAEFGDEIRNLYLPYPSDAFLTTNYKASAGRGVELLGQLVDTVNDACPTTSFVFTGYSQGADIIDGWAESSLAGTSAVAPDRVIAIATFGNPRRGNDVAVTHGTASAESRGILGARDTTWGALTDRVFDSCHDGDLWCNATPAMRRIAPDVMSASFNPRDAAGTRAAIEAVVGPEALTDPETREAVNDLLVFLLDGSSGHLQYETEEGGIPSARAAAREFLIERMTN